MGNEAKVDRGSSEQEKEEERKDQTSFDIRSFKEWQLAEKVVANEEILSSISQMLEVEVTGSKTTRRNRIVDVQYSVEDKDDEERRKSKLNGIEFESSK
ncbi:uncharacterized protein MONOS_17449 [Monocercomonoides exilis]|uniref:uncharacterized protein n=1 Tax=Monocercomonoides exilis TaxID=2049356 RepID=UPI0035593D39|nr:hypothetical protein MONOS_17449 [Monocercomonoides exilis]